MARVDLIIATYNGAVLLAECLAAVRRQTYADVAVLVVDDGSTDGTRQMLADAFPDVALLALPENRGLARALNAALEATAAEYVVLLNNDAFPAPGWLAALVAAADRQPRAGAIASRMRLADRPTVLHAVGDFYRIDGIPGNRGVWQADGSAYDHEEEVWAACAGAALYRRAALAEVRVDGHVFDPDLFMYCEDVDLGWRLRLAGWTTIYAPAAVVYHRLSATGGGSLASYWCGRNFPCVALANVPPVLLRRYWWRIGLAQVRLFAEALLHLREPAARARLRGQLRAVGDLPRALRRRRLVQALTTVPAEQIDRWLVRP